MAEGGPPAGAPGLEDVRNSDAFKELNELVASGELSAERAAFAKEKYASLHAALMQAMANEKGLLDRAKKLQHSKEASAPDVVGETEEDGVNAIGRLRDALENAEHESMVVREREQLAQIQVNELQREVFDHRKTMEEKEREAAEAMAPEIRALREEVTTLSGEVSTERGTMHAAEKDVREVKDRIEEVGVFIREHEKEKAMEQAQLSKAAAIPEKIKKQSEVVQNAVNGLRTQEERLLEKIREQEGKASEVSYKLQELDEQHGQMAGAMDRARLAMEQKDRAADEIRKDLELYGIETDQYLSERANIDMQLKHKSAEVKATADEFSRTQKAKEVAMKRYKKCEAQTKAVVSSIPALQSTFDQAAKSIAGLQSMRHKQDSSLGELHRDVETHMNLYLKEEALGRDKSSAFSRSYAEVVELERDVIAHKKDEHARSAAITELASQKARVSMQAAAKVAKWRDTVEAVRVKDLIIIDLKKKKKDTLRRLKDFQQLYDLVKNQRNKFVNLIQASSQSIAEMKEKLKILGNEIDILRNESVSKDRLLGKARLEHSTSQMERDHLRADLNRCALLFRDKQAMVDEQIAEVDKLNAIINSTEKEMLRLKKQYETHVENRNLTGIMLIDRNDELCILYEKANIQEEVTRQGEMQLAKRGDEIRMLELEVKEVWRSIEVTRKLLPSIPVLDESVAALQKDLLEAREEALRLSEELESPENKQRWRRLEGKIPDREELSAKISQLEERLNDKKEQLLEKELILEEVSTLSDRLRSQAAEGRADTLELAKKVNEYQEKLRGMSRRMMATVSELSMYQASALKLEGEKGHMEDEVADAGKRLEQGLPPTEECEEEWGRLVRAKEQDAAMAMAAQQAGAAAAAAGEAGPPGTRTTAEPRPNAYIPEDMGIPKPYGGYAPFKPTEAGATMRHIRQPQPREIQI